MHGIDIIDTILTSCCSSVGKLEKCSLLRTPLYTVVVLGKLHPGIVLRACGVMMYGDELWCQRAIADGSGEHSPSIHGGRRCNEDDLSPSPSTKKLVSEQGAFSLPSFLHLYVGGRKEESESMCPCSSVDQYSVTSTSTAKQHIK